MTHAVRRRWYRFIETVGSMVFLRIRTDENITVHSVLMFRQTVLSSTRIRIIDFACIVQDEFIIFRICQQI